MNSEPRMHPNGYLYRFARGLLTTVIAAVPLLFVVAVHYRSKLDDWSRNDVFGYFVLCALVLAGFWAWHFLLGAPRLRLASLFFLPTLAWVTFRTSWIVIADFSSLWSPPWGEHRFYYPPASPVWQPPKPKRFSGPEPSWSQYEYFEAGGSGGVIGEPYLSVDWESVTGKLTLLTVIPYLVARLSIFIYGRMAED